MARLNASGIMLGKMTILIPLLTIAMMGGYSRLVDWNLLSALVAWLILMPGAIFLLSSLLGLKDLRQAGISMLCFYGWMVLLIYDHYESDQFILMMSSLIYNGFIFTLVILSDSGARKHNATQ